MTVRSNQSLPRNSESLQMNLVANPVAGPGKIRAIFSCHPLQITVVVSIFKGVLQRIVVNITDRQLRVNARDIHRSKLKISHCTSSILSKGLIDLKRDLFAGNHLTLNKMGFDYFFS